MMIKTEMKIIFMVIKNTIKELKEIENLSDIKHIIAKMYMNYALLKKYGVDLNGHSTNGD